MIPRSHRAEEFRLMLSWNPEVNHQKVPTPGFYLRAGFANEGTAQSVVKGTWSNGSGGGNGSFVSSRFIGKLFSLLEEENLLVPEQNRALGAELANAADKAQVAALSARRARLERLRQEVAELEATLDSNPSVV
jgi:hypothetical protein